MTKVKKKDEHFSKKKTNQENIVNLKKYERQKQLTAERVRKYRSKMTDEQWEDKRRKDRERYKKKKEQHEIKSISELTEREKRVKRKAWKHNSKKYRERKKMLKNATSNTPPESENENLCIQEKFEESTQKKRGRKCVKRNRAKSYRTIKKQEQTIKDLKKKLAMFRQRLHRNKMKIKSVESPSPNTKVKEILGREKVSPHVKKRLFLGYALEKQLLSEKKRYMPQSKKAQTVQKVIGSKILRKYRVQKYFSKISSYKFNRYQESDQSQYDRKPSLSKLARLKDKLLQFYEDDLVSKLCPGKRDFKKKGSQKKQRRILLDILQNLHKRFLAESGEAISYTTFARARPFWVTPPNARDRETCACIVHSNMDLIVESLYSVRALNMRTGKKLLESVVCSVDKENCMTGHCNSCKTAEVKYNPVVDDETNVKFFQWKILKENRVIKGNIKVVKRMNKVKEVVKLHTLKEKLNKMLEKFKNHYFCMIHQAKEKKHVRNNLFGKELMFMIDFSENYCAKYNSEVQAMHFGASKKQMTLHTVVMYYNNGEEIVHRSFCTVSDSLAHQSYAVWAHLDSIFESISTEFPQTEIVHFFSDSPSSQYRNKINLHLLQSNIQNYFPFLKYYTWNFSEPGHGKGAMDGIGGALKRRADEKVAHGHDITCSADFVKLFQESRITVLEVSINSVESWKKKTPTNISAVPEIMKMKQIVWCLSNNFMYGRTLSCFQCVPTKEKDCDHYSLRKISTATINKSKPKEMHKLQVEDVWSSDEEHSEDEYLNKQTEDLLHKPGPSNIMDSTSRSICDENSIDIGTYVLVTFSKDMKKSAKHTHQFVGVCQSVVENSDVKVMFLKPVNSENVLFYVNEHDTSFISTDQIVAILPQPNLVVKGNRVYYKFNFPIPVF